MSADIISLADAREERKPHFTGDARCLACKHEWVAVVPEGTLWMECPECSLVRGRFIYRAQIGETHFVCNCGNDLFSVTPDGTYCPNCGVWLVTE